MKNLINNRLIIICGHYGTGKTNIAVNLAEYTIKSGKKCAIVDLDIVNPYFRTADNAEYLKGLGVRTIIPEYANTNVDIPTLPPSLSTIFASDEICVIDVGGDGEGARVLGGFAEDFVKTGYSMYYVFNKYRPENRDTESALVLLQEIEASSKLRFSGIINNSNLGAETTKDTVASSVKDAKALSIAAGIPVSATTAIEKLNIGEFTAIKEMTKKYF